MSTVRFMPVSRSLTLVGLVAGLLLPLVSPASAWEPAPWITPPYQGTGTFAERACAGCATADVSGRLRAELDTTPVGDNTSNRLSAWINAVDTSDSSTTWAHYEVRVLISEAVSLVTGTADAKTFVWANVSNTSSGCADCHDEQSVLLTTSEQPTQWQASRPVNFTLQIYAKPGMSISLASSRIQVGVTSEVRTSYLMNACAPNPVHICAGGPIYEGFGKAQASVTADVERIRAVFEPAAA